MMTPTNIKEHAEVLGSDGRHVGTVDHIDGGQIKLTKNDPAANGQHHFIPVAWVSSSDDRSVRLNKPAADAMRQWTTTAGPAM